MKLSITPDQKGFTLVEIMIVVAIIALLAALALPSFTRARKRSQAVSVKNDLKAVDSAIDQYALETNKSPGMLPVAGDIRAYVKTGSRLGNALLAGNTSFKDPLDHDVIIPSVDFLPKVPAQTYTDLATVADASFWSPFPTP